MQDLGFRASHRAPACSRSVAWPTPSLHARRRAAQASISMPNYDRNQVALMLNITRLSMDLVFIQDVDDGLVSQLTNPEFVHTDTTLSEGDTYRTRVFALRKRR
jgi:transposase